MFNRFRRALSITLLGFALPTLPAAAHPLNPASAADGKLAGEIQAFRQQLRQAVSGRDLSVLRRAFTDDFVHTHTSGKVDGKDARIVTLLAGESTVEMAPTPEFTLSCFGDSVCIVRALSPIKRGADGKWFDVRWTQTIVRTTAGWQIAVSQATGLTHTVRENP